MWQRQSKGFKLSSTLVTLGLFLYLISPINADVVRSTTVVGGAGAGGSGVGLGDANAWTSTNSFIDGNFTLIGSAGATKIAKFEVDTNVPVGTNTYTFPAASGTLAILGAQSFTGLQTFGGGGRVTVTAGMIMDEDVPAIFSSQRIIANSSQTNRALLLGVALGNAVLVSEVGDLAFNFAHAIQTNPTLFIHSAVQSTTQWLGLTHNQTDGLITTGLGDLKITPAGHVKITGTAPAVSACGTDPSVVTGSDHAGKLTTGSGGTTQSCTLTFAVAYSVAPACVANNETAIILLRATSTTTTLVIDSAVAGTMESDIVSYLCLQGS